MQASIPSHIMGATAGRARRLAGSDAMRHRAEGARHQRRRGERRRDRHPGALGEGTPQAGVSAGGVPPRAESRSREAQSRIPITAAKLSCQPTSPLARGLSARVARAASSTAYQRERGRPASAATTPVAAHDPRPLDRGAGTGDRHVERDQRQHARRAGLSAARPRSARERHGQQGQEHHGVAGDGEQVGEPGALEVVDGGGIDPVVLAEQEAAQERLLRVRRCRGRAPPPLGRVIRRSRPSGRRACEPVSRRRSAARTSPMPSLRGSPLPRAAALDASRWRRPAGRSEGPGPARGPRPPGDRRRFGSARSPRRSTGAEPRSR